MAKKLNKNEPPSKFFKWAQSDEIKFHQFYDVKTKQPVDKATVWCSIKGRPLQIEATKQGKHQRFKKSKYSNYDLLVA